MGELLLYFQVNIIIVEEVSRSEIKSDTTILRAFYINSSGKRNLQVLRLSQGQMTSMLHSIILVNVVFNQMKTKILGKTS